jgi:sugar phosphate isomerase/epimerase
VKYAISSTWHYRLSTPLPVKGAQLPDQFEQLARWNCHYVELARTDLLQICQGLRLDISQMLEDAGVHVAAITSSTEDGQGWGRKDLEEAFELASFFGAEGVITPAPPTEGAHMLDQDQLETWLKTTTALAEQRQVKLLLQNRPHTWADTGRRLDQLISLADTAWPGVAFDPAGFVAAREHPFLTSFKPRRFKPSVYLLRISDALFENGARVEVGQGNAETKELVSALLARSFAGFFSAWSYAPGASIGQIERAFADFGTLMESLGRRGFT